MLQRCLHSRFLQLGLTENSSLDALTLCVFFFLCFIFDPQPFLQPFLCSPHSPDSPHLCFLPSDNLLCGNCLPLLLTVTHLPLATVCLCFVSVCVRVFVSGGLWQGIDRSHSWVNSAYAPGGSRSVLRRNPNSSCDLKQVPNPSSASLPVSSFHPHHLHPKPLIYSLGFTTFLRRLLFMPVTSSLVTLFTCD